MMNTAIIKAIAYCDAFYPC